ncbi:C40 family peptidase [Azospirillum canadense]|uniref:C40 family peptidase n=1 Tax=Azospirillum canadense TaxID=403962 RepID=UPI00222765AC|nr:C40 family peptidase [Azospirillum canadense]MCW2242811.1 proteasome lid subunit RPN8/RPN11 [Azospirillum canadense]MCW2243571.1 proteasome lid subunit RPN8/RPN11 [Azospirillum canadense]
MPLTLTPALREAIAAHALAEFPKECCGLIVAGAYVPCRNNGKDPRVDFRIADDVYDAHRDRVQAIVHSHTNSNSAPTRADMAGQMATDVPWLLVMTDGESVSDPVVWGADTPTPDLIGRPFCHAVTDCYALIRDYFAKTHGITLPEFPRDDAWWTNGENLYVENFAAAGFAAVPRATMRDSDVLLMQIRSPVPNHAGVVVKGGALVLHHLQNRLSRREPLGPWLRTVTHVLRHKDLA